MSANASISLDAIASHPELARSLTDTVRKELTWRWEIAGVALRAAEDAGVAGNKKQGDSPSFPPPPDHDDLLDYAAAAHFLGRTVHWVKTHPVEIGGIKIARIWRFPRGRLRAILQARIDARP